VSPAEARPGRPDAIAATNPTPVDDNGTTHLPLLNRASNDFESTGLLGLINCLPQYVFVCVVIVRAIVRVFVRPHVCAVLFARVLVLSNRFLVALPQLLDMHRLRSSNLTSMCVSRSARLVCIDYFNNFNTHS
jgi:hypothetical protein